MMFLSRKGFTLSEVLLVLSVIGVVAALTIPTLVQKVSSGQYVSGFRKNSSIFSQAVNLLIVENSGSLAGNYFIGNTSHTSAMNAFLRKVNYIKNCSTGTGCWFGGTVKALNGNAFGTVDSDTGYAKALLSDGTAFAIKDLTGDCSGHCAELLVDVNGMSPPNTMGRDVYRFYIDSNVLSHWPGSDCTVSSTGYACGLKVMTEGTINY